MVAATSAETKIRWMTRSAPTRICSAHAATSRPVVPWMRPGCCATQPPTRSTRPRDAQDACLHSITAAVFAGHIGAASGFPKCAGRGREVPEVRGARAVPRPTVTSGTDGVREVHHRRDRGVRRPVAPRTRRAEGNVNESAGRASDMPALTAPGAYCRAGACPGDAEFWRSRVPQACRRMGCTHALTRLGVASRHPLRSLLGDRPGEQDPLDGPATPRSACRRCVAGEAGGRGS